MKSAISKISTARKKGNTEIKLKNSDEIPIPYIPFFSRKIQERQGSIHSLIATAACGGLHCDWTAPVGGVQCCQDLHDHFIQIKKTI
jgi:hypothetical protein